MISKGHHEGLIDIFCGALIIQQLSHHEREYNKSREEYYYNLRGSRSFNSVERAAKFITLNKTCYNGLYRVNKKGLFNVPMGRYKNPMICDAQNLRNISLVLRKSNSQLRHKMTKSCWLIMQKKMISFISTPLIALLAILQILLDTQILDLIGKTNINADTSSKNWIKEDVEFY